MRSSKRVANDVFHGIYDLLFRHSRRHTLIRVADGPAAQKFSEELEKGLRSLNTGFFLGGREDPQFNFLAANSAKVCEAIDRLSDRYQLFSENAKGLRRKWKRGASPVGESATTILVTERVSDHAFAVSPVHLCPWKLYKSYSSDEILSPVSRHDTLSRVPAAEFSRLLASGADPCAGNADPFKPSFPIDVVYTWVNDEDPSWIARKAQYTTTSIAGRATLAERFRNRDELKYSLRSIEMFAPWVNRVFIVTDDQTPSWLNLHRPKVRMVSHTEIYRDPTVLPTFNSSGI